MERFDRADEGTETSVASDRLRAFTQSLRRALVPSSLRCASVQGQLVLARAMLEQDLYGEGMENYYLDHAYRSRATFLFGTLAANRGAALDEADVAFFRDVHDMLDDDFILGCRSNELTARDEGVDGPELTDEEREELSALREKPRVPWPTALMRAMRCVANWCIANPELVDREGNPVKEGGIAKVGHIFDPPPPPPPPEPCAICKGKKWLPPSDPSQFPTACSCTAQ